MDRVVPRMPAVELDLRTQALLVTEWRLLTGGKFCDACGDNQHLGAVPVNLASRCYRPIFNIHRMGCIVDQALRRAGLPDQASRDYARNELPDPWRPR